MSRLYDAVQQVERIISARGLDPFTTKGQISMHTGFLLGFVAPDDPDDPEQLDSLRSAVLQVLGERLDV